MLTGVLLPALVGDGTAGIEVGSAVSIGHGVELSPGNRRFALVLGHSRFAGFRSA